MNMNSKTRRRKDRAAAGIEAAPGSRFGHLVAGASYPEDDDDGGCDFKNDRDADDFAEEMQEAVRRARGGGEQAAELCANRGRGASAAAREFAAEMRAVTSIVRP